MQTPMDKTLPYTDSSSPVKPIEASIGKLHKEVTEHFRSLNNDRARLFAHEFIQKYIKTQRIKSLDAKINVRNLYPLLIQQSSEEAVNFYEFLLISGYAEESDVDIHLLHAATVGSQRFVVFILQNVPAVQLELPKQLAAKQGHIEIFLMLIKRKRQKEAVVNDSVDLSLSFENFSEDSIKPFIDESIGEKQFNFISSPNSFNPNLFTESPIPMIKDLSFNNLESPSFLKSPSTSFYNSEEIGSFDRLMMQAVGEPQVTEDEDFELQQEIKRVTEQANEILKKLEEVINETNKMLGKSESSTDVLEDKEVATPISDVYSPVKFLIASISPFKPPRSSDSTNLMMKTPKIGLAPALDLDQELYPTEENDKSQSLAGLNRFGVFKDDNSQILKKNSDTNLSPR